MESQNCIEVFENMYHRQIDGVGFCPYRVCTLGAHIDHQHGKINGFAIDNGIHIAYGIKRNGIIELTSLNFPKRAQFHINSVPEEKENDWADHLRGATLLLNEKYPLHVGMCGVIEGSLPIGGLSSSAAVIIAFLSILCKINGITLTNHELILLAQAAENNYVGVSCGKLDQSCEVLSSKNKLLYLDTNDDSYEKIEIPSNMKDFKIGIFFSGLDRSLASSSYNMRVDECKSAAYSILAYAGKEYGKYKDTFLRDVDRELFESYKDRLPVPFYKRALHFYSEMDRVEKGVELFRKGDIESYGNLIFESGASSINNYECGSENLIFLYEILRQTSGVYGARFSGAGFKGCCMALIEPDMADKIESEVLSKYLKKFPNLEGKYKSFICDSADGVSME